MYIEVLYIDNYCLVQYKLRSISYQSHLAEPDDNGGHLNHWIVEQLMNRMDSQDSKGEGLAEPHYEDQWWVGGKSYVSLIVNHFSNTV